MIADHHLDADWRGAGAQHVDGLRITVLRNEKDVALAFRQPLAKSHCFGGRGGFVQQGRVSDLHAGQVGHHGLEIQQRFQPSLRNFRLVRRVGGIPGRVFQQITQDHSRRMAVVIPHADM